MKKILALIMAVVMVMSLIGLSACGGDTNTTTAGQTEAPTTGKTEPPTTGKTETPTTGNEPTDPTDPEATDPEATKPEATDPEATDPEATDPTEPNNPNRPALEGNFVPSGEYDGSAVTITFYHTMGVNLRTVLDNYIAEFNALYPNITIKHEQVGGYDDVRNQISTELTAGNQPNIAYCYPDHVALYNVTGKVITLDSLINSTITQNRADGTTEILGLTDEQIADFVTGYYEEGKQYGDGLMYTLPLSKSTEVLYYNKTFFDEHNLQVPTTWDEMEEVCRKILEIDENCVPLGYDSESNWFITMCEQMKTPYTSATGDHYLFNNDANKAFIKRFCEWYENGYVITQELLGSYTSELFTATGDDVRSYMSIGSSAGASYQRPDKVNGEYPFEVGIATIPQADNNNRKVISQGPSLCIFQSDNEQEVIASWLFVKFLTTNIEFQAEFSMASGYVPVLKSVADNEVYKKFTESADGYDYIAALSAKVCMEQVDAYYTSPAFNGSSVAREQVGYLLSAALSASDLGVKDVDAYIDELFKKAIDECEYFG